ncbi:MAG TPA: DUF6655 family protein [Tepidisphaeraceae bacterium]|jgi:hypothetical protein|nr:DUF6655 family protein [Tepidisphaeraceae bacterium]
MNAELQMPPATVVEPVMSPSGALVRRFFMKRLISLAFPCSLLLVLAMGLCGGCTTIRIVESPRTADLDFLLTGAATQAVSQLSVDSLRDRKVFVDTTYLIPTVKPTANFQLENELARQPPLEYLFLIGELRAKLLKSGVRLVDSKEKSEVVVEVRAGALSVNHMEFLLGVPASSVPVSATGGLGPSATANTPELSILKSTKQYGYASVSFVAYWEDTGELMAVSGPFVGKTSREDYWIFGTGPSTHGNIPPANQ